MGTFVLPVNGITYKGASYCIIITQFAIMKQMKNVLHSISRLVLWVVALLVLAVYSFIHPIEITQAECLGEGSQHIDQLTGLFNGKVRRKMVYRILTSYHLFTVSALGIVRSKDCIPGYTPEELSEFHRTDASDPCAGTTPACEDETRQEEIIITTLRFRHPIESLRINSVQCWQATLSFLIHPP